MSSLEEVQFRRKEFYRQRRAFKDELERLATLKQSINEEDGHNASREIANRNQKLLQASSYEGSPDILKVREAKQEISTYFGETFNKEDYSYIYKEFISRPAVPKRIHKKRQQVPKTKEADGYYDAVDTSIQPIDTVEEVSSSNNNRQTVVLESSQDTFTGPVSKSNDAIEIAPAAVSASPSTRKGKRASIARVAEVTYYDDEDAHDARASVLVPTNVDSPAVSISSIAISDDIEPAVEIVNGNSESSPKPFAVFHHQMSVASYSSKGSNFNKDPTVVQDARTLKTVSLSMEERYGVLLKLIQARDQVRATINDLEGHFDDNCSFETIHEIIENLHNGPATNATASQCGTAILHLVKNYPNGGLIPRSFARKFSRSSSESNNRFSLLILTESDLKKLMNSQAWEFWNLLLSHFVLIIGQYRELLKPISSKLASSLLPFSQQEQNEGALEILQKLQTEVSDNLDQLGRFLLSPDDQLLSCLLNIELTLAQSYSLAGSLVHWFDTIGDVVYLVKESLLAEIRMMRTPELVSSPNRFELLGNKSLTLAILREYYSKAGKKFIQASLSDLIQTVIKSKSSVYETDANSLVLKDWKGKVISNGNLKAAAKNTERIFKLAEQILSRLTKSAKSSPKILRGIICEVNTVLPADDILVDRMALLKRVVYQEWIIPALRQFKQDGSFNFGTGEIPAHAVKVFEQIASILEAVALKKDLPQELFMLKNQLSKLNKLADDFINELLSFNEKLPILESGLSLNLDSLAVDHTKHLNDLRNVIMEHYAEVTSMISKDSSKKSDPTNETSPDVENSFVEFIQNVIKSRLTSEDASRLTSPKRKVSRFSMPLIKKSATGNLKDLAPLSA